MKPVATEAKTLKLTKERAIEILGDAEVGVLTLNEEFKAAMKMGKEALLGSSRKQ